MAAVRRTLKNVVKNYTSTEVKVREATSNDPWGPSSTQMGEVADLTHNSNSFSQVMQMLFKRMGDQGKNWRHVFKSLTLLEYILKNGSEKVAVHCKENLQAIQVLKEFKFTEDGKDLGIGVREKAKEVIALLQDEDKLRGERVKSAKTRERFVRAGTICKSHESTSEQVVNGKSVEDVSTTTAAASAKIHESASKQKSSDGNVPNSNTTDSRASVPSASASASASTAAVSSVPNIEDLQLRLALALSKQEHERELERRKNETDGLQRILEESRHNQPQANVLSSVDSEVAAAANAVANATSHFNIPPVSSDSLQSGKDKDKEPQTQRNDNFFVADFSLSFTRAAPAPNSSVSTSGVNVSDPWTASVGDASSLQTSGFTALLCASPRNGDSSLSNAPSAVSSSPSASTPRRISATKALAGVQPAAHPADPWQVTVQISASTKAPSVGSSNAWPNNDPWDAFGVSSGTEFDFGSNTESAELVDPFGDSFTALAIRPSPTPFEDSQSRQQPTVTETDTTISEKIACTNTDTDIGASAETDVVSKTIVETESSQNDAAKETQEVTEVRAQSFDVFASPFDHDDNDSDGEWVTVKDPTTNIAIPAIDAELPVDDFAVEAPVSDFVGEVTVNDFDGNAPANAFDKETTADVFGQEAAADAFGIEAMADAFGKETTADAFGKEAMADAFGKETTADAFGIEAMADAFGQGATADAFGKEATADAFGKGATTDAFGIEAMADAFGKEVTADAFGKEVTTDAFGIEAMADAFGKEVIADTFGKEATAGVFGKETTADAFGKEVTADTFGKEATSDAFGKEAMVNAFDGSAPMDAFGKEPTVNNDPFDMKPFDFGQPVSQTQLFLDPFAQFVEFGGPDGFGFNNLNNGSKPEFVPSFSGQFDDSTLINIDSQPAEGQMKGISPFDDDRFAKTKGTNSVKLTDDLLMLDDDFTGPANLLPLSSEKPEKVQASHNENDNENHGGNDKENQIETANDKDVKDADVDSKSLPDSITSVKPAQDSNQTLQADVSNPVVSQSYNVTSLGDQAASGAFAVGPAAIPAFGWMPAQSGGVAMQVPLSLRMSVPFVSTPQFPGVAYPTLQPRMMQTQPFGSGMQMPTPMAVAIGASPTPQMALPLSMQMSMPMSMIGVNQFQLAVHPNACRMPIHAVPVYNVPPAMMYQQMGVAYAAPSAPSSASASASASASPALPPVNSNAVASNYGVGIALVAQPVVQNPQLPSAGAVTTQDSAMPRT